MNTEKRTQRPILVMIASVLALVLAVSAMPFAISATEPTATAAPTNVKVSLDGQVNLMFKFASPADSYTAEVDGRSITDLTASDDGWVSVPLMPTEMADKVTLTAQGAGAGIKFSVVEYANKVLAAAEKKAGDHDTVRALLNYGAMTQTKWELADSTLANDGIFVTNPMSAVTAILGVGTEANGTKSGTITGGTVSLVLGIGDIGLKYTVTTTAPTTALTASIDGVEDPVKLVKEEAANTYSFTISNVGVGSFENVWDVTISDGNNGSITSKHSVLEYLGYTLAHSADDAEKNVCRTLYQLYQHAMGKLNACSDTIHQSCVLNEKYYLIDTAYGTTIKCADCAAIAGSYFSPQNLKDFKPLNTSSYDVVDGKFSATLSGSSSSYITFFQEKCQTVKYTNTLEYNSNVKCDIGRSTHVVIKLKVTNDPSSTAWYLYLGSTYVNKPSTFPDAAKYKTFNPNSIMTEYAYSFTSDFADDKKISMVDGTRIIDTMVLCSSTKATATEIEYIAFVTADSEDAAKAQAATIKTALTAE